MVDLSIISTIHMKTVLLMLADDHKELKYYKKQDDFVLYLNINLQVLTQGREWYFCLFCEEAFIVFSEKSSWRHSRSLQVSVQRQSVRYIWKKLKKCCSWNSLITEYKDVFCDNHKDGM